MLLQDKRLDLLHGEMTLTLFDLTLRLYCKWISDECAHNIEQVGG